jgi:tetratricopeptide (TPR) repeat protein
MNAAKHRHIPDTVQQALYIFFLVAFVFIVYASNLDGPFIFDDSRIENNPQLHITSLSLHNLAKAGFESSPSTRPVSYMTFALNYYFHGFQTRGYHLVNICIHALAAILLFLLIRTTLNLPPLRAKYSTYTWLPFAAALVWAVHPLQTQSVSYIIQRMNSLAALFYILSLYLYTRARLARNTEKKWLLFIGALLAGILALGSKETAATLPFFIFLYEWYFFQDLKLSWLKRQVIPALIMLAGITLLVLLYLGLNPLDYITASYANREFTLSQRLLTEFRIVVFYISLLLFPHPSRLNLDHHVILSTGLFSPVSTLISAIILLMLFIAALVCARKYRLISFCLLWYLGNLVIESSFIGLELIFEHRNYLPSMLLVLLVLALILPILKYPRLRIIFIALVVLFFSFWTFERNRVWRDKITLWSDCATKSPGKARPHNNLGVALKKNFRLEEAVAHFTTTIRLDPEFTEAYNNLANSYILLGRYEEAIANYKMALTVSPNNFLLHRNLGNALFDTWQLQEALFHYKVAVHLNPGDIDARRSLASVQQMITAQQSRKKKRTTEKGGK